MVGVSMAVTWGAVGPRSWWASSAKVTSRRRARARARHWVLSSRLCRARRTRRQRSRLALSQPEQVAAVGASRAWMLLVWGLVLLAVLRGLIDRDGGVVAHVLVGLFLALIDGLAPLLWTVGEQSSPTLSAPPTDSGPHAAEPRSMSTGARPLPLHPAAARHTARARPRPTSSP